VTQETVMPSHLSGGAEVNAAEPSINSPGNSETLARVLADSADQRKASDITILHVAEVSYLADYFVVITAFSKPQVRAVAQLMQANAQEQCGRLPRRIEGLNDASWVLVDFGDVIAHILLPREREYYNLEAFWGHAERLPFTPTPTNNSPI
jgi:ribosome-associated protein